MQTSIVNFKKLHQGTRLDSEYYKPSYLETENILNSVNTKLLEEVSSSIKSFGAYALCNNMVLVDKGIPFIRCKDIKEGFVDFSDVLYIDEPTHKLLAKSEVKSNIVMLTMSGTVGNCAVANPLWKYPINSNQDIAKIETNKDITPCYLAIYLNSKYGKTQTARLPIGSIQQHIFLWQLKSLLIFIPSKIFQDYIANLYLKAESLLDSGRQAYSNAEQILLAELNLAEWKPKHRLSYVKNYSDTQDVSRIDAEYFQPMYGEIQKNLCKYKYGYGMLDDLVRVKDKKFTPKEETVYKYIELANISNSGNITGFTEGTGKELPTRARRKVNTGDVIVSSVEGSLERIALINGSLNNAVCSTGFYVINSDTINSETLLVFLKSQVGQLQLKKGCSGTILTAISKDEFAKILVPKIENNVQAIIKAKILEMYKAKALSDSLLNITKRGVEMAIEEDEAQAKRWIDNELNLLKIDI